MKSEWTRTEKLTLYALLVAIVGVSITALTVQEFRRILGLSEHIVTIQKPPITAFDSASSARPSPTPSSPKVSLTKHIEVRANKMWVDTGINVTGKTVRIEYESGRWSNGGDEPLFADGRGANTWPGLLVPSAPIRALVGKTASGTFLVGNYYEGNLGQGELYLSINDVPSYYDDNIGSLKVIISFVD